VAGVKIFYNKFFTKKNSYYIILLYYIYIKQGIKFWYNLTKNFAVKDAICWNKKGKEGEGGREKICKYTFTRESDRKLPDIYTDTNNS